MVAVLISEVSDDPLINCVVWVNRNNMASYALDVVVNTGLLLFRDVLAQVIQSCVLPCLGSL